MNLKSKTTTTVVTVVLLCFAIAMCVRVYVQAERGSPAQQIKDIFRLPFYTTSSPISLRNAILNIFPLGTKESEVRRLLDKNGFFQKSDSEYITNASSDGGQTAYITFRSPPSSDNGYEEFIVEIQFSMDDKLKEVIVWNALEMP